MAKKKQKKAAKRAVKRAGKRATKRGRVVAKRAARKKSEGPAVDRSLPESHVALPQADALKTLADAVLGLTASNEQIVREQREHRLTLEMLLESVAKGSAAMDRIEAAQQAPPRDPSLDVPASVTDKRRLFSGFCKTMNTAAPTPAIIGRIMHDRRVFLAKDSVSPRNLFERIYVKNPRHIAPKIRDLLERFGDPTTSAGKKAGKSSGKIAGGLGDEFDQRFALIVNIGCGNKDVVRSGKKTNYCRYLTKPGRELFDDWPEWTDETGGVGMADPKPPVTAPSAPEAAGTAEPMAEPTPTPEPDAGAEPEPTSPAP
jgi:hypothetical protein